MFRRKGLPFKARRVFKKCRCCYFSISSYLLSSRLFHTPFHFLSLDGFWVLEYRISISFIFTWIQWAPVHLNEGITIRVPQNTMYLKFVLPPFDSLNFHLDRLATPIVVTIGTLTKLYVGSVLVSAMYTSAYLFDTLVTRLAPQALPPCCSERPALRRWRPVGRLARLRSSSQFPKSSLPRPLLRTRTTYNRPPSPHLSISFTMILILQVLFFCLRFSYFRLLRDCLRTYNVQPTTALWVYPHEKTAIMRFAPLPPFSKATIVSEWYNWKVLSLLTYIWGQVEKRQHQQRSQ